jgi:hypothetical protein
MLCGFDYEHSKNMNAYSLMHYELIRIAITTTKHGIVDVGITADKAKSMMNFKPVSVCMDIQAGNYLLKGALRALSRIVTATIGHEGKLALQFDFGSKIALLPGKLRKIAQSFV